MEKPIAFIVAFKYELNQFISLIVENSFEFLLEKTVKILFKK